MSHGELAKAANTPWGRLPAELLGNVAGFLDTNEVACNLRLVNRACAAQFRSPAHTTVRLSKPSPPLAFAHRWSRAGAMRSLTLAKRRELLRLTVAGGSITNLQLLACGGPDGAGVVGCTLTTEVMCAAAAAGQLACCQELRRLGCPWSSTVMESAAGAGHLEVCAWLHGADCPMEWGAIGAAAAGGHLAVCRWLRSVGCPISDGDEFEVVDVKSKEVADWLLAEGWQPPDWAAAHAAGYGRIELAERLLDVITTQQAADDKEINREVFKCAAYGCLLPDLQRLHARFMRLSEDRVVYQDVMSAAADSPTPDWKLKVEWLMARGFKIKGAQEVGGRWCRYEDCAGVAPTGAAMASRLEWLRERGFAMGISTVVGVIFTTDDTAGMQYLIRERCLDDGHLAARHRWIAAVDGGRLQQLQLMHANGGLRADVSAERMVERAARAKQSTIGAWLVETLGVGPQLTAGLFASVASLGSAELLALLRSRGCPMDPGAWTAAAAAGSEEALECLAAAGCPMPEESGEAFNAAANHGDTAALRCLRRLGIPWVPTVDCFLVALRSMDGSCVPVLAWLLGQGAGPKDEDAGVDGEEEEWDRAVRVLQNIGVYDAHPCVLKWLRAAAVVGRQLRRLRGREAGLIVVLGEVEARLPLVGGAAADCAERELAAIRAEAEALQALRLRGDAAGVEELARVAAEVEQQQQ